MVAQFLDFDAQGPAICLAFVAAYALLDAISTRHAGPVVTEGAQ